MIVVNTFSSDFVIHALVSALKALTAYKGSCDRAMVIALTAHEVELDTLICKIIVPPWHGIVRSTALFVAGFSGSCEMPTMIALTADNGSCGTVTAIAS